MGRGRNRDSGGDNAAERETGERDADSPEVADEHADGAEPEDERDDPREALIDRLLKDMVSDLRDVIHAGKDLDRDDCRELLALPYLQRVLDDAGLRPVREGPLAAYPDGEPPIPNPASVRSAVRNAIQELYALSTNEDADLPEGRDEFLDRRDEAQAYYEVRMRLFGFTRATQLKGPVARRGAAREYYNQHINEGRREAPTEDSNFRKNIVTKELCLPIVAVLLYREEELRTLLQDSFAGISASSFNIGRAWIRRYWWFFRIGLLLHDIAHSADYFIRVRDGITLRVDPVIPLHMYDPDSQSDEMKQHSAELHLKIALYKVALVWRFINQEGWPPGPEDDHLLDLYSLPQSIMSDVLADFEERFAFTDPDADWIDVTINRILRDPRHSSEPNIVIFGNLLDIDSYVPPSKAFADAIDADPYGQVVYGRFAAFTNACRCLTEPSADPCMFHSLKSDAKRLNDLVELAWVSIAKLEASSRDADSTPMPEDIDNN